MVLKPLYNSINYLLYDHLKPTVATLMCKIFFTILNLIALQTFISIKKWVNNTSISAAIYPTHFQINMVSLGEISIFQDFSFIFHQMTSEFRRCFHIGKALGELGEKIREDCLECSMMLSRIHIPGLGVFSFFFVFYILSSQGQK